MTNPVPCRRQDDGRGRGSRARRPPGPTGGPGWCPGRRWPPARRKTGSVWPATRSTCPCRWCTCSPSTRAMTTAAAATSPAPAATRRDRRRVVPMGTTAAPRPAPVAGTEVRASPVAPPRGPAPVVRSSGTSSLAARRSQESSDVPPRRTAIPSHRSDGGTPPELASNPATSWCWSTSAAHRTHPSKMGLDDGGRLRLHGVERVRTQQFLDLGVAQRLRRRAHSPAPAGSTPRSARWTLRRPRPDRIRLFTVPSGSFNNTATSRYVRPPKYASSMG